MHARLFFYLISVLHPVRETDRFYCHRFSALGCSSLPLILFIHSISGGLETRVLSRLSVVQFSSTFCFFGGEDFICSAFSPPFTDWWRCCWRGGTDIEILCREWTTARLSQHNEVDITRYGKWAKKKLFLFQNRWKKKDKKANRINGPEDHRHSIS